MGSPEGFSPGPSETLSDEQGQEKILGRQLTPKELVQQTQELIGRTSKEVQEAIANKENLIKTAVEEIETLFDQREILVETLGELKATIESNQILVELSGAKYDVKREQQVKIMTLSRQAESIEAQLDKINQTINNVLRQPDIQKAYEVKVEKKQQVESLVQEAEKAYEQFYQEMEKEFLDVPSNLITLEEQSREKEAEFEKSKGALLSFLKDLEGKCKTRSEINSIIGLENDLVESPQKFLDQVKTYENRASILDFRWKGILKTIRTRDKDFEELKKKKAYLLSDYATSESNYWGYSQEQYGLKYYTQAYNFFVGKKWGIKYYEFFKGTIGPLSKKIAKIDSDYDLTDRLKFKDYLDLQRGMSAYDLEKKFKERYEDNDSVEKTLGRGLRSLAQSMIDAFGRFYDEKEKEDKR